MAKDYYDILGVKEDASRDEIKRAYRDLAKKYHPDANRGDKSAESKFKEISEAYSVLSNPEKRNQYNQMKKFGAFGAGQGMGGFDFRGFDFNDLGRFWKSQGSKKSRTGSFSFEDFFGSGGFGLGDIFSDIFDRGSRMRREKWGGKQPGESLYSELSIPFDLAMKGGRQVINITKEEECTTCHGTGAQPGTKPENCPTCNGMGTISMSQGFFAVNRPCPNCYGRGKIIKNYCTTCNGTGEVRTVKNLAINIPAGIKDGTQLKLKGQGQPGIKGGPPGDIFVTIRVLPHRFFKRQGNDIYCEVALDIIKAICGTKIRLKTINGKKVDLKIPPGTKDGRVFRLKGLGVNSRGEKGDQYVTIRVAHRQNLNNEERRIVEEFERN